MADCLPFHAGHAQTTIASDYRPDIDGLRAIAVLAVVIYHLDKSYIPGGFIGVDIFFVISGYVVTSSMDKLHQQTGIHDIVGFYARRVKRLMPALLTMVAFVSLLVSTLVPAFLIDLERMGKSGIFAVLGASNNLFATLKQGYFDEGSLSSQEYNPFLHTWSLGVEEQFYIIFPMIMSVRSDVAWGICVLLSLLVCVWLMQHDRQFAFFLVFSRFWELAAGVLLFKAQLFWGAKWLETVSSAGCSAALQLASLFLLGFGLIQADGNAGFPFPWALVPVLATLGFISAGAHRDAILTRCLSHWALVQIGKASYSTYLYHWPIFVFFKCTWGLDSLQCQASALAITVCLAGFSYRAIEIPWRAFQPSQRQTVFLVALTAVLAVQLWLYVASWHFKNTLNAIPALKFVRQPSTYIDIPRNRTYPWHSNIRTHDCAFPCRVVNMTYHLPPCAQFQATSAESLPACFEEEGTGSDIGHHSTPQVLSKNVCQLFPSMSDEIASRWIENHLDTCFLPSGRRARVYVIGNSHAGMYVSILQSIFAADQVGSFTRSQKNWGDPMFNYSDKMVQALGSRVRKGDLVFLAGIRSVYENTAADLDKLVNATVPRGANVLLVGEIGNLQKPAPMCVPTYYNRRASQDCEEKKEKRVQNGQQITELLRQTAKRPGVFLFDALPYFCDDQTCGAFIPGTTSLAYYDQSHLSRVAKQYITPFLRDFIHVNKLDSVATATGASNTNFPGVGMPLLSAAGQRVRKQQSVSQGRLIEDQAAFMQLSSPMEL